MKDRVEVVYRQVNWPFAQSARHLKREFPRPPAVSRPNSVTKRKQTTQRCPPIFTPASSANDSKADDTVSSSTDMASGTSFSKLDAETLRRIGWVSGMKEGSRPNGLKIDEDSFNKLSKGEFKRLSEQVRDVSMNLKNKFRPTGFHKLYNGRPVGGFPSGDGGGGGGTGDSVSQVYHNQLAASLKAFQQKKWLPIRTEEFEPVVTRCRPVSGRAERRSPSRPSSAIVPTPPQRPKSVPPGAIRPLSAIKTSETPLVTPGDFDTLSPNVLANLLGQEQITQDRFGDKVLADNKKDEDVSTSGIDSPNSNSDSSSDSDSESEPSLDQNRQAPTLLLRPEKLDSIYVPEDRRERRRFDFDAERVEIPPYDFDTPLPPPFCRLDLRVIARQKYDWRDILSVRPKEPLVETILDRLVEIEKLQSDTEEGENKRSRQRTKQRVLSAKPRDRRCCSNCLQPACVGDCPEKVNLPNSCTLCRQQLCIGMCQDTTYNAFMRYPPLDDEIEDILQRPVPRICLTCQKKHNAKLINANNAILRRPKSGNMTYSRGRNSAKPRDLRPTSVVDMTREIIRDIERLGLDPTLPRPNTGRYNRPRSRNSLLPGKSYFSNRKESLTELDKARKRKLKSLKMKRPKSVV